MDGVIEKGKIIFNKLYKTQFLKNDIKALNLKKTKVKFTLDNKKNILELDGNYALNEKKTFRTSKLKMNLKKGQQILI